MDSSARNGMKLSLVEVPNVVSVLSCAKKVLLAHILANKTEKKTAKVKVRLAYISKCATSQKINFSMAHEKLIFYCVFGISSKNECI